MKGIFSGRAITSLKDQGQKLTRTQTAKQAYDKITMIYGTLEPNAHYFHVGKGIWRKHNLARDKLRTGKYAESKAEWAERPHKLDWPGIDDKQPRQPKEKTAALRTKKEQQIKTASIKPKFSLSALHKPTGLIARKSKSVPVKSGLTVTKTFQPKVTESNFKIPKDIEAKLQKSAYDLIVNSKYGDDFKKRMVEKGIRSQKDLKSKSFRKDRIVCVITQRAGELIESNIDVDNLKMGEISAIRERLKPFKNEMAKKYAEKAVSAAWKEYKLQAIKAPVPMKGRKSKPLDMPKNSVVKQNGFFGKDLTQGKFRSAVNLKKSVVEILKQKFPNTQFAVVLSDHNQGSYSSIGVYWTGAPSEQELKILNINMGGQGHKEWKMNKHYIDYHHVDAKEMDQRVQMMSKDADSRRFWQVTFTQPITNAKKKKVDLKQALGKLKAPEKPAGRSTKVKPDKGISFVFNGIPDMPQKATLKRDNVAVTCYKDGKVLFSYTIKLRDVETAGHFKDTDLLRILVGRNIPDSIKKEYSGYSIEYAQVKAIEHVYYEYQKSIATKKPHGVTKKEPGTFEYFGKKLKEGKFKDDFANIKNSIIDILKTKYPGTLFLVAARGFYNNEADVYWTGGPSELQVKKLGIGAYGDYWSQLAHDVYWHHVSEDKMRAFVNKIEHNKALKTKAKVGYTRKVVPSDWENPKPIVKMPAKIPKETPAAVPKKQLKGRNVKIPMQKHAPVYKIGAPKKKLYKGFLVTGETYPVKNQIKAMGGKWNKDEGGWVVPATAAAAKQINTLRKAKGLKVSAIKTEENVFRRITEAERLDIRKEKYEKKVERWENKAGRMRAEESRLHKAADDVFSNIPFGQPLLVGHYSYKTDRNRRDRAWNNLGKSIHAGGEADRASRKAGVLSNVIDRIGTASDLKGRVLKLEKEYNHAKNKVTQAERDLGYARQRKSAEDIERLKKEIEYWQRTADNLSADIASIKERIPADAMEKQASGISMAMLGGTKLKPLVGATSVAKRYHNKNLSGGNFAIEVRKGDAAVELHGYHNTDGIITDLRVGTLYGVGTTVINKENFSTFEVSRLADLVKRALGAVKD